MRYDLRTTLPTAAPTGSAEFSTIAPVRSLGTAALARLVFEGAGLQEAWDGLIARVTSSESDYGALLDLSTLVQMTGSRDKGLELQAAAISGQRCYRTRHGAGSLRVLAFMTAGDLMANTPIDFLLEGSDVELTVYYVDGALPSPSEAPDHDVAFLAIGQSDDGSKALTALGPAPFANWPRPVVNGHPELIAALSRDGVADAFDGHPMVLCPATRRVERASLQDIALGGSTLAALHSGLAFPVIVRPLGSHAGNGLQKLQSPSELEAYLAEHDEAEFFVAAFVDYSAADGLFRKLRVVFVNGQPFVSHMAVSERWMVHYLNADMGQAANRAEEAEVMASFDAGFALRHGAAFAALSQTLGLDYFGIDCAETRDGRLLVFETDVAMIVHAMDSAELYPYKKPAMAKLFNGFVASLAAAARQRRLAA
ncbi:MAG: ATP-grasp domain-containing protein [Phenylobacterium sp.]